MCGIAGIVQLGGSRDAPALRVEQMGRMIDLIGHRGPDEAGTFVDERVALAATRLRIHDLTRGQQPMSDPSGRFWLVYNGEIYNHPELRDELVALGHRFSTSCDTEVALHAWMEWGEEAPARFEGGQAFAVYDRREQTVFLVRDRFGKRPLFYRADGDTVVFGSEIKVQLARPGGALAWDPRGLAAIFAKWTPHGEETPFAGVKQVPPGTLLKITARGLSPRAFVNPLLPVGDEAEGRRFEDAADRVATLLSESVRLRLRSDVEVGVLLSGGLDSTIIAQLARERSPERLRTFSIAFSDPRFDESADQERVVSSLGLAHSSIRVADEDIAAAFGDALWHAEVPQFRTALAPMFLLFRSIRAQGVKVVLSGEGADEVFLGYEVFKEARLRETWHSLTAGERRRWIAGLYRYQPHFSEANARALEAVYARASAEIDAPLASHAARLSNARFALRLLRSDEGALDGLQASLQGVPALAARSLVRRAQWLEFHTLLIGYLLSSQGDRMAFAHGVEPRNPFMAPTLVELASRLPERFLLSPDGDEKHLLKHAFRARIPAGIADKPKRPYRAPDAAAFRSPANPARLLPWAEDLLSEENLRGVDALEPAAAIRFLDKLRRTPPEAVSPREDQAFVLLLSLAALDHQFVRGRDVPSPTVRPPRVRQVDLTCSWTRTS